MKPLRDLEPRCDPRGGSPKTPIPIPVKDLQAYVETTGVDDSGLWKAATTGACGLFIGMTAAWWTARDNRGVSQAEMASYVSLATAIIAKDNSNQDRAIGELIGKQDRTFEILKGIGEKHVGYENSITEINSKIKFFGDYVEEQRKAKR